jgi:hypothetical protein
MLAHALSERDVRFRMARGVQEDYRDNKFGTRMDLPMLTKRSRTKATVPTPGKYSTAARQVSVLKVAPGAVEQRRPQSCLSGLRQAKVAIASARYERDVYRFMTGLSPAPETTMLTSLEVGGVGNA